MCRLGAYPRDGSPPAGVRHGKAARCHENHGHAVRKAEQHGHVGGGADNRIRAGCGVSLCSMDSIRVRGAHGDDPVAVHLVRAHEHVRAALRSQGAKRAAAVLGHVGRVVSAGTPQVERGAASRRDTPRALRERKRDPLGDGSISQKGHAVRLVPCERGLGHGVRCGCASGSRGCRTPCCHRSQRGPQDGSREPAPQCTGAAWTWAPGTADAPPAWWAAWAGCWRH